jgi:hypothetical protein
VRLALPGLRMAPTRASANTQELFKEKEVIMPLTQGEKNHWKDRIEKRIDHRIEMLVAKEDPTLLQRVEKEAQDRAYKSLGIDGQQHELEAIEKQKEELEKREQRLAAEQVSIINGTPVERELSIGAIYHRNGVEEAVDARAKALEADILAECDLGRRVLSLREEKDNLLDTVWLATSNSQIKDYDAYCTSFVRSGVSGGNRRRSESFRPGLLTGAFASGAG